MAKWILTVATNCTDPARETEFNEWYDKTHLPDILETPGFIRATRYENIKPLEGEAKFLAVYEIEADDIREVMKVNAENLESKRAAGRFCDLTALVARGVYRQISSLSK